MSDLPLISVIVPVYNVEKYLNRCVESIVGQTYDNLEILLVDDGSTDNSGILCDVWSERDERVQVIHKKNGGAGAARNVALDMAKGEFVGLVDSDDYLDLHMYAHLYSLIQQGADIAECTIVWTDSDNASMDDGSAAEIHSYSTEQAMRLSIREEAFCQTPPNKLYRRSTIADIRFPEGNLIDDEFWTYRVIGKSKKIIHICQPLYNYVQHESSVMHKEYNLKRLQALEAQQLRLKYIQNNYTELKDYAEYMLYFACMYHMQMCLKYLDSNSCNKAFQTISQIISQEYKKFNFVKTISPIQKFWVMAARINFKLTCKIRNLLKIGI